MKHIIASLAFVVILATIATLETIQMPDLMAPLVSLVETLFNLIK